MRGSLLTRVQFVEHLLENVGGNSSLVIVAIDETTFGKEVKGISGGFPSSSMSTLDQNVPQDSGRGGKIFPICVIVKNAHCLGGEQSALFNVEPSAGQDQAVVIRDGSGSSLPGLDKGTGQPSLDRAYKANVSFKEGTKTPADEFSG